MLYDTEHLAENKLILLYIFEKLSIPVSKNKITEIVLKNNYMNYFTLQQYIDELMASEFISFVDNNKKRLIISEKGKKVLSLFKNRINSEKVDSINELLKDEFKSIKNDITLEANYISEGDSLFLIKISAYREHKIVLSLKVHTESEMSAKKICEKWNNSSNILFESLMSLIGLNS